MPENQDRRIDGVFARGIQCEFADLRERSDFLAADGSTQPRQRPSPISVHSRGLPRRAGKFCIRTPQTWHRLFKKITRPRRTPRRTPGEWSNPMKRMRRDGSDRYAVASGRRNAMSTSTACADRRWRPSGMAEYLSETTAPAPTPSSTQSGAEIFFAGLILAKPSSLYVQDNGPRDVSRCAGSGARCAMRPSGRRKRHSRDAPVNDASSAVTSMAVVSPRQSGRSRRAWFFRESSSQNDAARASWWLRAAFSDDRRVGALSVAMTLGGFYCREDYRYDDDIVLDQASATPAENSLYYTGEIWKRMTLSHCSGTLRHLSQPGHFNVATFEGKEASASAD